MSALSDKYNKIDTDALLNDYFEEQNIFEKDKKNNFTPIIPPAPSTDENTVPISFERITLKVPEFENLLVEYLSYDVDDDDINDEINDDNSQDVEISE